MSKVLDEIRDKEALENTNFPSVYKKGFDAAIALNLPVLFDLWKIDNKIRYSYKIDGWIFNGIYYGAQDLYSQWLNNIYTPQP